MSLAVAQPAPQVKLDVQVRPFVELYFAARAAEASAAAKPQTPADLLALASIDATAVDSETAEAFLKACADLPESIERGGQTIVIRDTALALARRLVAMSDRDREAQLARTRGGLDAKKRAIESALQRWPPLLPSALQSLEMGTVDLTVPVVLVSNMPSPGAATFRATGGRAISVVGVELLEGSDLVETVLHEVLHAVDVQSAQRPTVLQQLRAALTNAGVPARNSADCLHAVIFAQAAATVKRVADAAHEPVGAKPNGPYSRMSPPARETVNIWTDHAEGRIDLATAIAQIVAAAK